MTDSSQTELGPLASLVGAWEGEMGHDTAPSADRGTKINLFRERMTFESIGRVDNHEQVLFGLRYAKKAWRIGEPDPFHEEVGYYLWDGTARQVMRCFIVPRGVAVIAGGDAAPEAKTLIMAAAVGSPTYGICSNQFLDREFKTVRFSHKLTIGAQSISYEDDSELEIKGQTAIFHHLDRNILKRV